MNLTYIKEWNEFSTGSDGKKNKLRDINILNDNFPKLIEIFKKVGVRITRCFCVDNCLKIAVHGERVEKPDKELLGRIDSWAYADSRVGTVRSNFQMGKAVDGYSMHNININIQHGICDTVSPAYQKYIDWLDKYNINSFDEYLRMLTITTRDCNKNAKVKDIDKGVKKMCYQVKDWVVKYLFRNDYIDEVKGHKIESTMYYLLYTKAEHKDSMDGRISFHIPLHRSNKFYEYLYEWESYPEETREYAPRTSVIDNPERMQDFLSMVNSNLFDGKSTTFIKGYLETKSQ
jgi:hypothetical protein